MPNLNFNEDIQRLRQIAKDNLLSLDQVIEIYKIRTLGKIAEELHESKNSIHIICDSKENKK